MKRNLFQVLGVIAGLCLAAVFFTQLLTPTWTGWNIDNTMKGIYKEPKNSINILFLGNSQVIRGISPMYLYKHYGMSAYSIGTEHQSLLTSYYWLKEIERFHPESLSTVVLNIEYLFDHDITSDSNAAFAEKALAYMKLSPVKIQALKACESVYNNFNFKDQLFPLYNYHSRWSKVNESDFSGLSGKNNFYYTRGQDIDFKMASVIYNESSFLVPKYKPHDIEDYTIEDYQKTWFKTNKDYLEKIVENCKEKNLNLILTRLPKPEGNQIERMQTAQFLSEYYDIPVIDFNEGTLLEEIGIEPPFDFYDDRHPNYYGSEKFTDYIGKFIRDNYQIADVRNDPSYEFLARQADEFSLVEEDRDLRYCRDLNSYLDLIDKDRYTVFLVSKGGHCTEGLTEHQKQKLYDFGFSDIYRIENGNFFIGIKDKGHILINDGSVSAQNGLAIINGKIDKKGYRLLRDFSDDEYNILSIKIAGSNAGDYSSLEYKAKEVRPREYSLNMEGLTFLIYDNQLNMFIDRAIFDTRTRSCPRMDGILSDTYLARCEKAKLAASGSLEETFSAAITNNKNLIILLGTKNESGIDSDVSGFAFWKSYGLNEIGKINDQPFLAVFRNGTLFQEGFSDGDASVVFSDTAAPAVIKNDEIYSISIGDETWTPKEDTISLLVYNEAAKMATYWKSYDGD